MNPFKRRYDWMDMLFLAGFVSASWRQEVGKPWWTMALAGVLYGAVLLVLRAAFFWFCRGVAAADETESAA